jgi:hypothetical protein
MNWGKFTVKGSAKVENKIKDMLQQIAAEFAKVLLPEEYKAVILLGGYGRGEGGVLIENGVEKPHNNFDLLLIYKKNIRQKLQTLHNILGEFSQKNAIGIDLGTISACKLKHARCRLMWYDMRYGHKTILGDERFVSSIKQFKLENVPDWDILNLMVNRGTLMIINDLLLEKKELEVTQQKLIVKHLMKAIIGYGDALLYFLNNYSWSYLEKQQLMRQQTQVDSEFQSWYDAAIEFRFQPDYIKFLQNDLTEITERLRQKFSQIFLYCGQQRLKKKITNWTEYPDIVFRNAICQQPFSLKSWAKKAINFFQNTQYSGKTGFKTALGYRFLGKTELLSVFFPFFAFQLTDQHYKNVIKKSLLTDNEEVSELRKDYLRMWSKFGDVNFSNMLKKYGIEIGESV